MAGLGSYGRRDIGSGAEFDGKLGLRSRAGCEDVGDVEDPLPELVICVSNVLPAEFDSCIGVEAVEDEIAGQIARCLSAPRQVLHLEQVVGGTVVIQPFDFAGVRPVTIADPAEVEIVELDQAVTLALLLI